MALTINEPIKTVNGLLTEALAAKSQLLYIITTDVDLNAVLNYRINLEIRDAANTFSLFDKVFSFKPNNAGVLDLDVGGIVTDYMGPSGLFSFQYFLRVIELWDGSNEPSTDTTILQAIVAKKQLLSVGGANMWENLLRLNTTKALNGILDNGGLAQLQTFAVNFTGDLWVGQSVNVQFDSGLYTDGIYIITAFELNSGHTYITIDTPYVATSNDSYDLIIPQIALTKFINPVMWRGWNRTASYLIDQQYEIGRANGTTLRIENWDYNINKGLISQTRVLTFTNVVPEVKIAVSSVDINTLAEYRGIRCTNGSAADKISELLFYRVQPPCKNPIMLDWINSLGGIDQWLFETSQAVQVISDAGIIAEKPINTDIENITRTKQRFANTFRQQLTLRAQALTLDQLLALQEIKQTESLRVYLSKDGTKFIDGIVVTTFTTDYNNKRNDYKFVVVIELPDGFIFENGKLY